MSSESNLQTSSPQLPFGEEPVEDSLAEGFRSLTLDEISALEQSGCTADDWNDIIVADGFTPGHVSNTAFYGHVTLGVFDKQIDTGDGFMRSAGIRNATLHDVSVGDNCIIENIGNYISHYDIGEESTISNVGRMAGDEGATYGEGTPVAVLNEAGDGNVIVYDGLTSQMAAFMVAAERDAGLWERLKAVVRSHVESRRGRRAAVGYRVKIVNTREIINAMIGDECEINCASRLYDCTLAGSSEASVYIGNDVICESTVVDAGASILGGAKVYNCFVGEACHVGKGFSAENCVFFANSYMDNGEACAAFCGPFTVSHHKSTLLIGGMYSFYNAGSGTNYSNHAYKLGPIHYGVLGRGAKTASGAHLLMPATIGAFSMCMGKIQNHPDTSSMPFSYVIASDGDTALVPGRNLATVGTCRDVRKWPKRDMRPRTGRRSIVNFDWLSPYTVRKIIEGKKVLERLRSEQGDDAHDYSYGGCTIRRSSLVKGIQLYDMAINMYFGAVAAGHPCTLPTTAAGTGAWTDLAGLLVPESEVERVAADIKDGTLADVEAIESRLRGLHDRYAEFAWNWAYGAMLAYYGLEMLTDDDRRRIADRGEAANAAWRSAVAADAEREAQLGDMDEALLKDFLDSLR